MPLQARLRGWIRHTARDVRAHSTNGSVRLVQRPWRWWDGFLDDRLIAAGFTLAEVQGRIEGWFDAGMPCRPVPRPVTAKPRRRRRTAADRQPELFG